MELRFELIRKISQIRFYFRIINLIIFQKTINNKLKHLIKKKNKIYYNGHLTTNSIYRNKTYY